MTTKPIAKTDIVRRARQDIGRILDRYQLTMPEVIGVSPSERDIDEEIWESIKEDYEKIQEQVFAETYPDLWKKIKKGKK